MQADCNQTILDSTIAKLRGIPPLKMPLQDAQFFIEIEDPDKLNLLIHLPTLAEYQEVADLTPIISQQLLRSTTFKQIKLTNSETALNPLVYPVIEATDSILISESERSQRAAKHWNFLLGTPGILALHSAHAEQDFAYLSLRCQIPERLCKAPSKLLRRGLSFVPPDLEEVRRFYLEKVISGGSTVEYAYEHVWRTLTWRFRVSLIPLGEEVLAITHDNDRECPWQENWWKTEFRLDDLESRSPWIFPETQSQVQ